MIVGCDFTFRHYKEIIEAAKANNFTFSFFTGLSRTKRIYLRHDVDVSLKNALEIAKIEKEKDVCSTFFIRLHASFYNPIHFESLKIIKQIKDLGHQLGLHYDKKIDKSFDLEQDIKAEYDYLNEHIPIEKVVSFHKPDKDVLNLELREFINAYSPYFFNKIDYISDSNRELKKGCIKQYIKNCFNNIQVLIHPIWWYEKTINLEQIYEKLLQNNKVQLKQELIKDIKCFKDFYETH